MSAAERARRERLHRLRLRELRESVREREARELLRVFQEQVRLIQLEARVERGVGDGG